MEVRPDGERGAAVADFAMVSALVLFVVLAVVQVGLALHTRNTLISCASEGARYGARAGATLGDGQVRARDLITASLSARYADDVTVVESVIDGVRVVEVRVRAPVPVIGLVGPDDALEVRGRAFLESQ